MVVVVQNIHLGCRWVSHESSTTVQSFIPMLFVSFISATLSFLLERMRNQMIQRRAEWASR